MANSLSTSPYFKAPFFGKSAAYVGGRDPLGLQTTSVATYTRFLPGITNVTNRVRYWSFYCWLVQLYSEKIREPDTRQFVQFIRRGEFLLAVAIEATTKYEPSVSGTRRAANAVQDLPLDISKYADANVRGNRRYWQYDSGAFGQYFMGVMVDLGLLCKNDYEILVCSDQEQNEKLKINLNVSGKALASAYREAIGSEIENRYLQVIEHGFASANDLQVFGEKMTLSAIQPDTTEWNLIRKILVGRDSPGRVTIAFDNFFRQSTIRLFLDFRRLEQRSIVEFPIWLEERKGSDTNGTVSDVAYGWFYYAVNEHWHYANELIFNAFLDALHAQDFSEFQAFVQGFIADILQLDLASSEQPSIKYWFNYWRECDDMLNKKPRNAATKALQGFFQILALQEKYKDQLDEFIRFGQRLGIERRGDFAHGLRLIGNQIHLEPIEFLEWYLVRQLLNRHLFVAMDKLAITGVNTQKFKLEEQVLIFIDQIGVDYTNPRLSQLARFLQDLKVLDQNFLPTELATTFLEPEQLPQK